MPGGQLLRAVAAGPEAHLALRAIVEEDLAVRRLIAGFEGFSAAFPALQLRQGELDVLAGAERIGGEVGTGAVIAARLQAANATQ